MTSKYSPIEQKAYVVSSARIMIGNGRYVSKGSKMLLGSKIKDGLNKIVDGLVDASNGKMPEGFDPSQFKF